CGRYTPWAAVDPASTGAGRLGGGGGLWLDISGCAHLGGGEAALVHDLLKRMAALGFAATAAVAETAGAAWAVARLARTPVSIVSQGDVAARLRPLPIEGLRLPAEALQRLHRLGLSRIGDLMALPRAPLSARLGEALLLTLDQALGRVDEPLSPRRPQPEFLARLAFAEPLGRLSDVTAVVALLVAELSRRLQAAHRGARQLELSCYRSDGTLACVRAGTSRPSVAEAHMRRLLRDKLEGLDVGFGIEVMTLGALATEPHRPAQAAIALDGTDAADTAAADGLGALIDRLSNRLGAQAVVWLAPHASHIPERAFTEIQALSGVTSTGAAPAGPMPRLRQPRPLTLFSSPEPIEVVAPVPEGPPALFRWRRLQHRIIAAEGPERIAPEWWRSGAGADLSAASRDYYRVEDADGCRFWVYREGPYRADAPPRWYLHGLFG
ncbi:MAG: DNA polymerase Y family protein, partial [Defluviicoccus sp.]